MTNKNYWKCINLEKEDEKANKRIKIKQKNKRNSMEIITLSTHKNKTKNY